MSLSASKLAADEQAVLRSAVEWAEQRSGLQIRVVIADRSDQYERSADAAGLLLGLIAAGWIWIALPSARPGSDSWAGTTSTQKLLLMAAALVATYVVGSALVSRLPLLLSLFVPRRSRRQRVAAAAEAALGEADALIYVSRFEKRAVILAVGDTLDALGEEGIDRLCEELTQRLSEKPLAASVATTVRHLGQRVGPEGETNADEVDAETS